MYVKYVQRRRKVRDAEEVIIFASLLMEFCFCLPNHGGRKTLKKKGMKDGYESFLTC